MTHDDLIKRLEWYDDPGETICREAAAALRKSEADLKAAREDCKSIEARKDLVQIMLDTARKAYRERDNELSRQRETIGKLREALEHLWTMGIPEESVPMVRAALSDTDGVSAIEPTVVGRKDEPSGDDFKNGLSPQADAGEIVRRLRLLVEDETGAINREREEAASLIERQADEIKKLRSELSGRLGQPFGDPAKS